MTTNSPIPTQYVRNLLTGEVILVQAGRGKRPWLGAIDPPAEPDLPTHQAGCDLCPGETRKSGHSNPTFDHTFVFPNDYPALIPCGHAPSIGKTYPQGLCEVVVFSPTHNVDLLSMAHADIVTAISAVQTQYLRLKQIKGLKYLLFFINKGKEMGNSQPHPHGQTYAYPFIPPIAANELKQQKKYFHTHGQTLLSHYFLSNPANHAAYTLYENAEFSWVMPPWAAWPAETIVIPKKHVTSIDQLSPAQISELATIIQIVTKVYGIAFMRPKYGVAYSMALHQAPIDGKDYAFQDLHLDFYPPFRDPWKVKFMVGAEMAGMRGRDSEVGSWISFLRSITDKLITIGVETANLVQLTSQLYSTKNHDVTLPF